MRIYVDLCCLKRPFDDQTQTRIHLETEAVLSLLEDSADLFLEFVHAPAHDLENDQNPLPRRAKRVRHWLDSIPLAELDEANLTNRTRELMAIGFKNFDAFHLASAELAGADVMMTCDDRMLSAAQRNASIVKIRVVNPVDRAREVFP